MLTAILKRPVYLLLLFFSLLPGCCISPAGKSAYILDYGEMSPSRTGIYRITLMAGTGKWVIGGHAMGAYEELRTYIVDIPTFPSELTTYSAKEITMIDNTGGKDSKVVLVGGFITVQPKKKIIEVALDTAQGAFVANGIYSTERD